MVEKFKAMSKEEYYEKYIVGIRFLFGYEQENDYKTISLRVYLPKFREYENIVIFEAIELFKKTQLFEELTKQTIKIDFEKQEFIISKFFKENNIEIIPYFSQGIETEKKLSKDEFFEFLKQNEVKELNYLCFLFFSSFCEEEYEYFCNIKN
ncbi:hypothetical protein IMC75_08420 (plasmid) [Campylobacter peloridis]|uniref:Uncharacterized protein n=1 Tax=Campylobacter peloridis TaxID=488546 RepID=A0ABX6TVP5_9BACT|nr:hypothetical protein [Campylobacter peloridis]AJC85509.1 hypothetical protein CPEL_a44 [Campylobacter peloridis LMG 23910]QOQ89792.1 hypothetical protein IMC75_08420 [Campylobacter peloridis]